MTISMYQASIPLLLRGLTNLRGILAKASAHCQARSIDPAVLVGMRLAPDMYPLSRQVQIVSDTAKGAAARLAGIEVPRYADTEATFAELEARIGKTIAFLQSVGAAQIDGSEERNVVLQFPNNTMTFTGQGYLTDFVIPNFHFHLSMTYAILRHAGVAIGKEDYLGKVA